MNLASCRLPSHMLCLLALIILFMCTPASAEEPAAPASDSRVQAIEQMGGLVREIGSTGEYDCLFYIRGRDLADADLEQVGALRGIVSLNLRETQITGAGLEHLANLTNLRRLHLERTAVDDQGIAHLKGLSKLEYLNLYGTQITDKALEHLAHLKNLKRLYVWETDVTDASLAKLQQTLPELKIVGGVDLSKLPIYQAEKETPAEKPTKQLKFVTTSQASDAPKSVSGLNVQVYFQNKSGKKVKLYWVSYGNQLMLYSQLAPNAEHKQNTYTKNTWLITDVNDRPLGYFLVDLDDDSLAVIPELK